MKHDSAHHFQEPILKYARTDFARLPVHFTVQEALNAIRQQGIGEKIVYFYVVAEDDRLVGVVPTRRLLTAPLEEKLQNIMITRMVVIPHTATVLEACEQFILHKFLAFPVVDERRRIVGMVDVQLFTGEIFDFTEREQAEDVFEMLGFRLNQVRDATPLRAFRYRFPWLMPTVLSGTLCALLAGAYELTLARSILLAFFLTLVLALGESVSIQSMTLAIQTLRATRPTWAWFGKALRREMTTALLLGLGCGILVSLIVWLWRGVLPAALVIGGSISLSLTGACFVGLGIPTLLHALRWDPKVAAGPLTLALADIFTLLCYFNLAALFL
ncbi:magnesium transporter [Fontisphaera persica]|uniref:magnesium transporter n=1 Tax=Fontisphaera persica TaxID=2974023 RepID=UPI0024BF7CE6|nr:magnesium transporter [Fontisphaera persica]WCJ58081.1 magnesium transporter [Fontisphaera persica]